MSNELVKVVNGGIGGVTSLDPTAMLSTVRADLQGDTPPLMQQEQSFMISGAPLMPDDEPTIPLSEALEPADGGGTPILTVGDPQVTLPTNTSWVNLSSAEQLSVLNTVAQITKGLTIGDPNGGTPSLDNSQMFKTTFDSMEDVQSAWMTSEVPRVQTAITTNSYFSEFAESMATSSSNSASASVTTPYGGGSASFSYAQSHSSNSSKVSTFSVGTYNVNIAVVELDTTQIQLSSDFVSALTDAVSTGSNDDQFVAIIQALNKYGWYLATKFTVGGVLYTSQSSESSSWAEAQSTSTSFGGSFQASFDGIGGGAAYNQANKSGTTSSGSSGSNSLSFTAIGGSPADSNDFAKWSASMVDSKEWNISNYLTLTPSIYPLYNMGSTNKEILTYVNNMIAKEYANCPELGTLQPMIDCGQYALSVKEMLPGFG